jgi:hypothetical protein
MQQCPARRGLLISRNLLSFRETVLVKELLVS